MNVMVLGVEHSGTRLVCGCLKIHPEVKSIRHISLPAAGEFVDLEKATKEDSIDKIVLVMRDRCCNDLSLIHSSSLLQTYGKQLSGKPIGSGSDFAISHAHEFIEKYKKDVVLLSMESMAQNKELALRQTFRLLGIDEASYDYGRADTIVMDWFGVELKVIDPNEKYFAGKRWPLVPMEHFYQGIDGWFDFEDVYKRAVERAPTDRQPVFVEIGSWMGKSTAYMGVEIVNSGKDIRFFAVDNWSGSPGEQKETGGPSAMMSWMNKTGKNSDDAYEIFKRNIEPVSLSVNVLRMESGAAARAFQEGSIDFLFLDGDHSYGAVKRDLAMWIPKIRRGGTLAGHDIDYPPVARALCEVFPLPRHRTSGRSWIVDL